MPISTPRDDNHIPTLLGTSNVDGTTVIALVANPSSHRLATLDGNTGSGFPYTNAQRDANRVPALWAVSSADGTTPVPVYCSTDGKLLIQTS